MPKQEIRITADGSHTLYTPFLDEHYHSINGAIQESEHVFIRTGLNHCPGKKINILEFGLGTGLNALLSLVEADIKGYSIHYTAIEKYPLSTEIIRQLNYTSGKLCSYSLAFEKIHSVCWGKSMPISTNFTLLKIQQDFNQFDYPDEYDLIYYDAFAPDKQANVWNEEIFCNIYKSTAPSGILVTYCAKGNIRRMLQQAGFQTERLPGPPGKREMLRAIKLFC